MDVTPILGSLVEIAWVVLSHSLTSFFFEDFCGPEQRQTLTSVTSSGIDKADGITTGEWYAVFSLAVKLLGEYFGYAFSQFAVWGLPCPISI